MPEMTGFAMPETTPEFFRSPHFALCNFGHHMWFLCFPCKYRHFRSQQFRHHFRSPHVFFSVTTFALQGKGAAVVLMRRPVSVTTFPADPQFSGTARFGASFSKHFGLGAQGIVLEPFWNFRGLIFKGFRPHVSACLMVC